MRAYVRRLCRVLLLYVRSGRRARRGGARHVADTRAAAKCNGAGRCSSLVDEDAVPACLFVRCRKRRHKRLAATATSGASRDFRPSFRENPMLQPLKLVLGTFWILRAWATRTQSPGDGLWDSGHQETPQMQ